MKHIRAPFPFERTSAGLFKVCEGILMDTGECLHFGKLFELILSHGQAFIGIVFES